MSNVTVYLKPTCPFCQKAMGLLRSKGVSPTVINIAVDRSKKAEMVAKAGGRTTVPQIFIDGKHVGGCDDLHAFDKSGQLNKLLGK